MYDIFMSHSARDTDQAIVLAEMLKDQGLRVWLDLWYISPGTMIESSIREAITNSKAIVIILSNQSSNSIWMQKEVLMYQEKLSGKRQFIIPVIVEKLSEKSPFWDVQTIDLTSKDKYEEAVASIKKVVNNIAEHPEIENILNTNNIPQLLSARNFSQSNDETRVRVYSSKKEIISSNTVTSFNQSPLEIVIGDPELFKVKLKFTKDISNEQKLVGESPNKSTLILTLINFDKQELSGTPQPLQIGTLSGYKIYIHLRVFSVSNSHDKTVNYTIYKDLCRPEVNENGY